jgi:hypothetical protein
MSYKEYHLTNYPHNLYSRCHLCSPCPQHLSDIIDSIATSMNAMLERSHFLYQPRNTDTLTKPKPRGVFLKNSQAEQRSKEIDRAIEKDAEIRKRICNVLPLGAFSMREIVQQLSNSDEIGLARNERIDYRYNIYEWWLPALRSW